VAYLRSLAVPVVAALVIVVLGAPAAVTAAGTNGRIAFMRWDVPTQDQFIWTVNPDGTHDERLLPYPAQYPRWSPDGRQIAVLCCESAARIVTVDTGATRDLPTPDGLVVFCNVWSPDGARLYCTGFGGSPDENVTPELNGIYSIRSSDGGDLRRVTVNAGGQDNPQSLSPDGSELVFISDRDLGSLFVIATNGGTARRLEAPGVSDISSAAWSPDGRWLVFPARKAPDDRRSLFMIRPDGTGLREIVTSPSCGGFRDDRNSRGCLEPTWSPDGSKILFDIFQGNTFQKQLQTIDLDGSHRHDVTRHGFVLGDDEGEQAPDWGTHPLG